MTTELKVPLLQQLATVLPAHLYSRVYDAIKDTDEAYAHGVNDTRAGIDRMVTRCNEGCAEATNSIVRAAYASVLGALNDLTAPTSIEQTFVESEPGDACCDGTHTRDCTGPCSDPDDVRDRAREREADK